MGQANTRTRPEPALGLKKNPNPFQTHLLKLNPVRLEVGRDKYPKKSAPLQFLVRHISNRSYLLQSFQLVKHLSQSDDRLKPFFNLI